MGYQAFRQHLIDRHGFRQPSTQFINDHRVDASTDESSPETHSQGAVRLSANEFTNVLAGVSDMISRNVNQGIGTILQTSTAMASMFGGPSMFGQPMFGGQTDPYSRSAYPTFNPMLSPMSNPYQSLMGNNTGMSPLHHAIPTGSMEYAHQVIPSGSVEISHRRETVIRKQTRPKTAPNVSRFVIVVSDTESEEDDDEKGTKMPAILSPTSNNGQEGKRRKVLSKNRY